VISTRERRPARRRRHPARWVVGLVLAFAIFAIGIALGAALSDNPKPNLIVTTTKTVIP
jgi:hypothetical protein